MHFHMIFSVLLFAGKEGLLTTMCLIGKRTLRVVVGVWAGFCRLGDLYLKLGDLNLTISANTYKVLVLKLRISKFGSAGDA